MMSKIANQKLTESENETAELLYAGHKRHAESVLYMQNIVDKSAAAREFIEQHKAAGGDYEDIDSATRFDSTAYSARLRSLHSAQHDYDANMWQGREFAREHLDMMRQQAAYEARQSSVNVQLAEQAFQAIQPEAKTRHPKGMHEIEIGEPVSFAVGFDKKKLRMLDVEAIFDAQTWDRKGKIERIQKTLDGYSRLPQSLRFTAGITAIFGENGSGKTMLADIIITAIELERYRQTNDIPFDKSIDLASSTREFFYILPGHETDNSTAFFRNSATEYGLLVVSIAECMRVDYAELYPEIFTGGIAKASRTTAALGNTMMGMSSRQIIDYKNEKNDRPSHKDEMESIYIYDEPELGLSPVRQRSLVRELTTKIRDGVVGIIPSNSIILFESSAPRINLDTPEKGIHILEK